MGERARIARFFAPLTHDEPGSFALTDDAGVLAVPAGQQLVVTTDSVIEGLHVMPGATPAQFAQKLVRRNLSDLAAMGATPWRYSLNLHTPPGLDDTWFERFVATLAEEQAAFGLVLIGGDSTSGAGPIHSSITLMGLIAGNALRRRGAMAGEDVYVSGVLGGAAYALHLLQHGQGVDEALAARYHTPEPRLALGQALRGIASSGIDLSDGLLADAAQLCDASQVGIVLEHAAIPHEPALMQAMHADATLTRFALNEGDDYELLFTAHAQHREAIGALSRRLALPLTRIGRVIAGDTVVLRNAHGQPMAVPMQGYEHG